MRIKVTVKGFMLSWVVLAVLMSFSAGVFFLTGTSRARDKSRISAIAAQYLAESALDISISEIKRELNGKLLNVYYGLEGELTDSDAIYTGIPEVDFGGVCGEVIRLIIEAGSQNNYLSGLDCEISILNKTLDELKPHLLDRNGNLFLPDVISGELLSVEYSLTVTYRRTRLDASFTLSGMTFDIYAGTVESGELTIELFTENAVAAVTSFSYLDLPN